MGFKIPHKIRISPRISYEVLYVDKFDDPTQRGECRRLKGKSKYEGCTRQILLLKDLSEQLLLETFIHETLHAIETEYKFLIPHKVIELLERPILRILKLNGWI